MFRCLAGKPVHVLLQKRSPELFCCLAVIGVCDGVGAAVQLLLRLLRDLSLQRPSACSAKLRGLHAACAWLHDCEGWLRWSLQAFCRGWLGLRILLGAHNCQDRLLQAADCICASHAAIFFFCNVSTHRSSHRTTVPEAFHEGFIFFTGIDSMHDGRTSHKRACHFSPCSVMLSSFPKNYSKQHRSTHRDGSFHALICSHLLPSRAQPCSWIGESPRGKKLNSPYRPKGTCDGPADTADRNPQRY